MPSSPKSCEKEASNSGNKLSSYRRRPLDHSTRLQTLLLSDTPFLFFLLYPLPCFPSHLLFGRWRLPRPERSGRDRGVPRGRRDCSSWFRYSCAWFVSSAGVVWSEARSVWDSPDPGSCSTGFACGSSSQNPCETKTFFLKIIFLSLKGDPTGFESFSCL